MSMYFVRAYDILETLPDQYQLKTSNAVNYFRSNFSKFLGSEIQVHTFLLCSVDWNNCHPFSDLFRIKNYVDQILKYLKIQSCKLKNH